MGIVSQPFIPTQKLLASARYSAENLDQPKQILSRSEGIVDLGTIEWCLRPAFPIRGGRFSPPVSPPWNDLSADEISLPACRVCRIDMGFFGSEPFHLGTGFVLGSRKQDAYLIVTNAHVVSEAVRSGWPPDAGLSLYCDFDRASIEQGGPLCTFWEFRFMHLEFADERSRRPSFWWMASFPPKRSILLWGPTSSIVRSKWFRAFMENGRGSNL